MLEIQASLNAYLVGATKKDKLSFGLKKVIVPSLQQFIECLFDCSFQRSISNSYYASEIAIGAVFEQKVDDSLQLLGFFPKNLPAQQCYSAYDCELLAVYINLKFFRYFCGQDFIIRTDHKSLVYAFQQKSDKTSLR